MARIPFMHQKFILQCECKHISIFFRKRKKYVKDIFLNSHPGCSWEFEMNVHNTLLKAKEGFCKLSSQVVVFFVFFWKQFIHTNKTKKDIEKDFFLKQIWTQSLYTLVFVNADVKAASIFFFLCIYIFLWILWLSSNLYRYELLSWQ